MKEVESPVTKEEYEAFIKNFSPLELEEQNFKLIIGSLEIGKERLRVAKERELDELAKELGGEVIK